MRKFLERFLLSVLLTTSVVLGLTFWMNMKFGFNMLAAKHWQELASLQATHTPINKEFYISLGVGVFILIFGLYLICRPRFRKIPKPVTPQVPQIPQPPVVPQTPVVTETKQTVAEQNPVQQTIDPQTNILPVQSDIASISAMLNRPPKLNLPKNMETLAQNNYLKQKTQAAGNMPNPDTDKYDQELHDIFQNNKYLVKPNFTIAGLKTNLFAIANHEILWIGAVDCDINKLKTSVGKLKALFEETLEDIPININAFILDTQNIIQPENDIKIFHSIKEVSDFMAANPADDVDEYEKENFDAYSDYIDNIISMAPHLMQ